MVLADRSSLTGYLNPARLKPDEPVDILTQTGEHKVVEPKDLRAVYFVREFSDKFEPERKSFLSRPKLDGLWVRLTFLDGETLEGVVPNDLLALLDSGVQFTPPDLGGAAVRVFVPRSALKSVSVLGVVGVARRQPTAATSASQPKLFTD